MGLQGNKGFLFFRVFRAFRGQGVLSLVRGYRLKYGMRCTDEAHPVTRLRF